MSSHHEHDPAHDTELRSELLRLEGDAPLAAERAGQLRRRVMLGAELPLVRLRQGARRRRSWKRARPYAPFAMAAALAGVLLLGPQLFLSGNGELDGLLIPAALRPAIEEALGAHISEEEFLLYSGTADAGLLLTAAIDF